MRTAAAALLIAGGIGRALAQDDLAALELADRAQPDPVAHPADWRVLLEGSYGRSGGEPDSRIGRDAGRVSLDLRYQHALLPGVHVVLADRLDVNRQAPAGTTEINTLKEAYLSWAAAPSGILDIGRINVRNGVALAYNPTDYFRFGAVREVVSLNPASLRENRLGSVMLRAQQLWSGGSATALVSPRLQDPSATGPFSADWGASNNSSRWLLAVGQRLAEDLAPQVLLAGQAHQPPQAGLNLTHLLGDATVAYLEGSTGRTVPPAFQAAGLPAAPVTATRLSTGLTYTTPVNLTFTVEYERNGAALSGSQWLTLRQAGLPAFGRALAQMSLSQDLPDRQALFLMAQWTDSLVRRLDLQGFMRMDLDDHSRLGWLEARYHFTRVDVALQWQQTGGSPATIYGNVTPRTMGQLLVDVYLP